MNILKISDFFARLFCFRKLEKPRGAGAEPRINSNPMKKYPISKNIPNEETIKAIEEMRAEKADLKRYTAKELIAELRQHLDDDLRKELEDEDKELRS